VEHAFEEFKNGERFPISIIKRATTGINEAFLELLDELIFGAQIDDVE